ncbi:MAG: FlgD immunoglobulin-like domain containing protein [bacterium]
MNRIKDELNILFLVTCVFFFSEVGSLYPVKHQSVRKKIAATNPPKLIINEVVTDPQQDWNDSGGGNGIPFDDVPGNGSVTNTDEWVELFNADSQPVNLTAGAGWSLELNDGTPDTLFFSDPGSAVEFVFSNGGALNNFQPGEYLVIGNPPGTNLSNDIFLILRDASDTAVDDVELGDDPEDDGAGDGAPDGSPGGGNATDPDDEAIARLPNAGDTDDDVADFTQQAASIGSSNDAQVCVTFDFPVVGGAWYMISLPVIPEDNALNALFPEALAAFGWDYATQSYVPVTELDPERTYWLLMLEPAAAEVCGEPLYSYTKSYSTQVWDMIGSVIDTGCVIDDPPGSVLMMFCWDPETQSYFPVAPPVIEPKQGCWILVFGVPCTVTVRPCDEATNLAKLNDDAHLMAFYEKYDELPPGPPFEIAEYGSASIPERFGLSQNYPNPFNPETVIEYQLPETDKVSLTVYSILGQEVRTLVDSEKSAGYHRVIWDGTNDAGQRLASGVYLVRIEAREFVRTRKVVLLK